MHPITIRRLRVTTVVLLGAAGLMSAHAASLGGIDAGSLDAWVYPADIDVGPVACASFDLPGGSLDGQPVGCGGGAWTTSGGNWRIVNGEAKATTRESIATVPGPSPYMSASVDVIDADKNNREGGVLISHDGAGNYLAAVIVGPDMVELRSTLGFSVSVPASIGPSTRFGITRTVESATTDAVTVTVDGAVVINESIQNSLLPSGSGAGLYHGGGPPVSFDNFQFDFP